jgi:hypothetical protein
MQIYYLLNNNEKSTFYRIKPALDKISTLKLLGQLGNTRTHIKELPLTMTRYLQS